MQLVHEQVLVDLGERHGGAIQRTGIDGDPLVVRGALDPVGDHHVRVQMRLSISGVPVVPLSRDQTLHGHRCNAAMTGSRLQHVVLQMVQSRVERPFVTLRDLCLNVGAPERPENACILRDRERQIEASNVTLSLLSSLGQLVVICVSALSTFRNRRLPEAFICSRIAELLPHRHCVVRTNIPKRTNTQTGNASAIPSTWRVSRLSVVGRESATGHRGSYVGIADHHSGLQILDRTNTGYVQRHGFSPLGSR